MPKNTNSLWTSLSGEMAASVEEWGRYTAGIEGRGRFSSSGLVWGAGIVVTAAHTIRREDEIPVTLPDGNSAKASLAGLDRGTDIAALRIEGAALSKPRIGGADPPRVGTLAVAVGRSPKAGVTASLGLVSAISGAWRTWRGGRIESLLRLDVNAYPGLSGSAVIGADGGFLGIATTGLSRFGAIVLPEATLSRVVEDLVTRGRVARPYLGVALHPVAIGEDLRARLGLESNEGLIVLAVETGGPAERAGVLIGDVLVSVDGRAAGDIEEIQSMLDEAGIGREVAVAFVRASERKEMKITAGERPRRTR